PSECSPAEPFPPVWRLAQLTHIARYASKGAAKGSGTRGGGGKHKAAGARGGKDAAGAAADDEESVVEFDITPFASEMSGAVDHFRHELSGIRTGRASPGLLEAVTVHAPSHGSHVPLRALGTVVARSPQLLVVEVYSKDDAEHVATAIRDSPLKLQARVEGGEVLVEVPRMTLEMVQRMVRLAAQEAESARAAVRRVRHRALEAARRATGGDDQQRRREQQVQATTDQYVREVDTALKDKEKALKELH
ncbi:Ribosome-recycling factor, partial [Tetrabaena socialis]